MLKRTQAAFLKKLAMGEAQIAEQEPIRRNLALQLVRHAEGGEGRLPSGGVA